MPTINYGRIIFPTSEVMMVSTAELRSREGPMKRRRGILDLMVRVVFLVRAIAFHIAASPVSGPVWPFLPPPDS